MTVVGFSSFAPLLPIFNGEKYEWWSIKMKTLLISQELWDLVEHGFVDILEPTIEEKERLRETKKNDVNALFIIQQAIHETIFLELQHQPHQSKYGQFYKRSFREIQRS